MRVRRRGSRVGRGGTRSGQIIALGSAKRVVCTGVGGVGSKTLFQFVF